MRLDSEKDNVALPADLGVVIGSLHVQLTPQD